MEIGKRIYDRMNELNMTQKEFCKRAGLKQSTVSEWRSKKTTPTADKIMPICKVLDVTPEWLLSGVSTYKTESIQSDYYIIAKKSDSGVLIDRVYALKNKQRDRLLGYLAALEQE